jgi:hypothetical protein
MRALVLAAATLLLPACACAQVLVALATRPGVTEPVFIADMGEAQPRAVALLYSGGYGDIHLRLEDGRPAYRAGNFLLRSYGEFIRNGVLPVMVDAPSDFASGMPDSYRRSDAQVADARAVLREVRRRFPGVPVFIVTTSRSTLSGAHLGRALGAGEVDGVVLSSSMAVSGAWESLAGFDFRAIKAPLLFVHHRDDGCKATPYYAAERLASGFALISVEGGLPPKSGPCDSFAAHGYYGVEPRVVDAMSAWMLKQPFPKDIR